MSSVISPVSGTPTGTPSRSDETLLAQSYFAKIVAYDQFDAPTTVSTETAAVGTRNSLSGSLLNNLFFGEISLPATTATTSTVDVEYPINMALPPGYRIIDGFGTTVAAGWFITAYGGDY